MEKRLVKKAVEEAEKDLKEKQIKEVKKIVLKTLEKINSLKDDRKEAQAKVKDIDKKLKILKMDIDDLKEGRLDRISERQEKDEEAKATSVVIIIKEKEVVREYPYWHWPYRVIWERREWGTPYRDQYPTGNYYTTVDNSNSWQDGTFSINCSIAKWASVGSYNIRDKVINLR